VLRVGLFPKYKIYPWTQICKLRLPTEQGKSKRALHTKTWHAQIKIQLALCSPLTLWPGRVHFCYSALLLICQAAGQGRWRFIQIETLTLPALQEQTNPILTSTACNEFVTIGELGLSGCLALVPVTRAVHPLGQRLVSAPLD